MDKNERFGVIATFVIWILYIGIVFVYVTVDSRRVQAEAPRQAEVVEHERMLQIPLDYLEEPEPEIECLGSFKVTAYCSCESCCGEWAYNRPNGIVYGASGMELVGGYSIAVDPTVIPYGTIVIIDGQEYIAADCGGAIKGNRIDLYYSSHERALQHGVGYYDVYVKEVEP